MKTIYRYGKDGPTPCPGKVYLTALPVALKFPDLRTYAYKDECNQWHVIEAKTGESMGSGRTRKEACEKAYAAVLHFADRLESIIAARIHAHNNVILNQEVQA